MKFSWQDIVFDYCDIVIPVRATLLMIESQGMAYLMNDHSFLNNYRKIVLTIEGVRIKTRLSHIFMKNELRVFFTRKPDYAENLIMHLLAMLQFLCTHWLRQIYVI